MNIIESLLIESGLNRMDLSSIRDEHFLKVNRVQDWRNHIMPEHRKIWEYLSDETKLALYATASYHAQNEEWD